MSANPGIGAQHPHFVHIPDPKQVEGVRHYREPAEPRPLQVTFLEAEGERAWVEEMRALLAAGRAAEADARLAAELSGFDGALARLCKATHVADVGVEGWDDLLPILAEWEGPPVTAITLGLTNPPDLVFEAGATHEPELLLGLYSDEAFAFGRASNAELLAECEKELPAWVGAKEAFACGLIDRLVEGELIPHAVGYAEEVRDVRPLAKSSERQDKLNECDPAVFDEFRKANAKRFRGFEAPLKNIDAVKVACEKPYSEGVIEERKLFMELMSGTQAKAQQYFFFAERKANKIEGLPENTQPRDIRRVGVVGAGTMGGGISMNFLSAGIPVTIVEMSQDALDRGTGVMLRNYEASAAKGKLTAEQVGKAMGLLEPTLDFQTLAECDLVIEAVYENMEVKKEVFGRLDKVARPGAILASNTSYLNINEIAASISRPGDVVGMHFFSPANVMKLLEVVRGDKTAPDVLLTAMQLGKKIRKVPVVAGVCHGFIGNRMLMPRQIEATKLLLEGATPEQVDKVHVEFGMPMGPFQMADLAGVDIGWHRDPNRIENIRDALCAIDRWVHKKGAGFYDYDEKRRPSPSPVVQQIIEDFAKKQGVERREISNQEIVERTLYTMVNEGAKILEEGIAQRASDVDVVWVYGYGWPVYRGGPMFWADTEGLDKIVAGLKRQEARMKPEFSFSQLLLDKAEKGNKFTR
jgi:3-hydroxyacyl-CoA dehydrogenase